MKKLTLFLAFLPMAAFAQQKQMDFQLKGKLKNISMPVQKVYLQYRMDGEFKRDSATPENNTYQFSGKINEPLQARLQVLYKPKDDGKLVAPNFKRDFAMVFIGKGKTMVNSVDSFSNIKVKGSAAHTEYMKLTESTKPYNSRLEPLYTKYSEYSKAKDKENQDKVEKEIDAIDAEMREAVYGDYVKKNPSSPLAAYALQQYAGWDINPEKVEPLYEALSSDNKSYPSAVEFKENLEIAKLTGIGKLAMDFTQNDTLGNPVSLSSFKGHYVLVDFWASWCGPCRAENPNVVKAFQKFRDQNFHIIGVSLDRPGQKEKWLKAIHDDGLTWTHVSDLKFWDNEVAKQYGIKAIPQNLLLDPTGKIVAKNLSGEELDQKLGELLTAPKAF